MFREKLFLSNYHTGTRSTWLFLKAEDNKNHWCNLSTPVSVLVWQCWAVAGVWDSCMHQKDKIHFSLEHIFLIFWQLFKHVHLLRTTHNHSYFAHIQWSTTVEKLKHLVSECPKHFQRSQRAATIYCTTDQQMYYSDTWDFTKIWKRTIAIHNVKTSLWITCSSQGVVCVWFAEAREILYFQAFSQQKG